MPLHTLRRNPCKPLYPALKKRLKAMRIKGGMRTAHDYGSPGRRTTAPQPPTPQPPTPQPVAHVHDTRRPRPSWVLPGDWDYNNYRDPD